MNKLQNIEGMSEVSGVSYIPEDVTKGGREYYRLKKEAGLFTDTIRYELKRARSVKAGCGIGDYLGVSIKEDVFELRKPEDLHAAMRRSGILR